MPRLSYQTRENAQSQSDDRPEVPLGLLSQAIAFDEEKITQLGDNYELIHRCSAADNRSPAALD